MPSGEAHWSDNPYLSGTALQGECPDLAWKRGDSTSRMEFDSRLEGIRGAGAWTPGSKGPCPASIPSSRVAPLPPPLGSCRMGPIHARHQITGKGGEPPVSLPRKGEALAQLENVRETLVRIRDNKAFETFVITVIIISGLVVGARTYTLDPTFLRTLNLLDYLVTGFFLVEILIRMASERSLPAFFRKGWNVFDFLVVTASLVPVGWASSVMLARLLRIFRILRLISFIPELRLLVNALVKSLPRLGYVAVMMFVIFYIYGAVGSIAFRSINEDLWGNISLAMLTLFRIATFEDWTDVMYETMTEYPLSWIYYVTFIFLAAFVFLNMVIGIILEVMQREHEQYDKAMAGEQGGATGKDSAVSPSGGSEDIVARLDRIERLLEERR